MNPEQIDFPTTLINNGKQDYYVKMEEKKQQCSLNRLWSGVLIRLCFGVMENDLACNQFHQFKCTVLTESKLTPQEGQISLSLYMRANFFLTSVLGIKLWTCFQHFRSLSYTETKSKSRPSLTKSGFKNQCIVLKIWFLLRISRTPIEIYWSEKNLLVPIGKKLFAPSGVSAHFSWAWYILVCVFKI